jgi:hypothetical protein
VTTTATCHTTTFVLMMTMALFRACWTRCSCTFRHEHCTTRGTFYLLNSLHRYLRYNKLIKTLGSLFRDIFSLRRELLMVYTNHQTYFLLDFSYNESAVACISHMTISTRSTWLHKPRRLILTR